MKSGVLQQLDSRVRTVRWYAVLLMQLLKQIIQVGQLLAMLLQII